MTQPEASKRYTGLVCRGSWALGTACGKCERCRDTRPVPPEASKPESAAVEPVAVIGKDWQLLWASPDTLKDIVERTNIAIGSELIPATALTALTERVERLEGENARLRKVLLFAFNEAKKANIVIAERRAERGQGRITVATALHRIARETATALKGSSHG